MLLRGGAGRDVLKGGSADDTLYGFGGDDVLTGAGGDDVLAGHEGADSLSGGVGDDYMLGGAGNDTIDGGAGIDWAAYEDATSAVKVDLALTIAQNTLGGGIDRITGVENLYGSAFNDTLIGNAGANYLSGGAGNDSLSGGAGDDHLEPGLGNDTVDGGAGVDLVSFQGKNGVSVRVDTYIAFSEGDDFGVDYCLNFEDVYGSAFSDQFDIWNGGHYVGGAEGADQFNASYMSTAAANWLDGGEGVDLFLLKFAMGGVYGGEGVDTLDLRNATTGLKIDLAASTQANGGMTLETDSIENVRGSGYNDTLCASDVQNVLEGGGGLDLFVFRSLAEVGLGESGDIINHFYPGTTATGDRIDFSAIDANTTLAGNQAFTVVTTFTHQAGQMVITGSTPMIFVVTLDVNGDAVADASLRVNMTGMFPDPQFPLEAGDFIL